MRRISVRRLSGIDPLVATSPPPSEHVATDTHVYGAFIGYLLEPNDAPGTQLTPRSRASTIWRCGATAKRRDRTVGVHVGDRHLGGQRVDIDYAVLSTEHCNVVERGDSEHRAAAPTTGPCRCLCRARTSRRSLIVGADRGTHRTAAPGSDSFRETQFRTTMMVLRRRRASAGCHLRRPATVCVRHTVGATNMTPGGIRNDASRQLRSPVCTS